MSKNQGDVPPNYGGLVIEPNHNDVLSGRGGRINAHPGNVQFRELVKQYRGVYLSSETKKLDKAKIAHKIVEIIRNMDPPGRFLREGPVAWQEIGDEKARKKAGQAMREKAEETRKELEHAKRLSNSPQRMLPGYMPSPLQSYVPPGTNITSGSQQSYLGVPIPQQYMPSYFPGNPQVIQQMHNTYINGSPQGNQQITNMYMNGSPQGDAGIHSNGQSLNQSNVDAGGLLAGNAVAFDREFNRLSGSSSSGVNSLRMSSIEGSSFNSSNVSSEFGRSSISSQNTSTARKEQMQMLQTISDERERKISGEISIGSTWNDSWDQGPIRESQVSINGSVESVESRRRRMFHNMKSEASNNLPSSSQTSDSNASHHLNENELLKESIISVEMRSTTMQNKTAGIDPNHEKTTVSYPYVLDGMSDIDMDHLLNSSTSLKMSVSEVESNSFPNIQAPRPPEKQKRQTSDISAISDVSRKPSGNPEPWAGFEHAHGTMPNLPLEMSDINRHRLFSENSMGVRSISMFSDDISQSMNNLDLDDNNSERSLH